MTHANNPTTITDQAFAEFVEVTKVTVISPDQVSWKNPFGWIKGQESKLDFGILYNIEERVSEGYTTWISPLHDHVRVSFVVGDSVWGNIQLPKTGPTSPSTKESDRFKLEQMLPLLPVVDETCTPLVLQFLDPQSPISSSEGVHRLLETHRSMFQKLVPGKE